MSTNKPDMIADIVADMRRRYDMMTDAIWAAPLYCSMDKTQAEADILNEFLGRLEAAMKREAIIHTDNSKVNAALIEDNERLAKALADAESRVKLWTDRADELRLKCDEQYAALKVVVSKTETPAPSRPCDTMNWRDAWAKWRTEMHPQKPETYGEAYDGTVAFMDWFTTPMKGE